MFKAAYLCGPMSNYPKHNYPAFHAAAAHLRRMGNHIISPAEIDDPATQAEAMQSPDGKLINGKIGGKTWGDILARDVKIIADEVHGIVLLPGWKESRGAKLEAVVGLLCGHDFYDYHPKIGLQECSPWVVREALAQYL